MSHPSFPPLSGEIPLSKERVLSETDLLEQYVSNVPLNQWEVTYDTVGLLWRTAKSMRVRAKKYNETNIVFFFSDRPVGSFDRQVTSLVSSQAWRACGSWDMARSYLEASRIPLPAAKKLPPLSQEGALDYARAMTGVTRVQSTSPHRPKRVAGHIRTAEQLTHALEAVAPPSRGAPPQEPVILEQLPDGLHLRFYVVAEKITAALIRVPFYIVGDGRETVAGLYRRKRENLAHNQYLALPRTSVVNRYLSDTGFSPEEILRTGQCLPVSDVHNASGGECLTVEVTKAASQGLAQLAISAMWAFPGLAASGVDIVTPSLESAEGAVVTDVDPAADITEFRYPSYGQSRRVGVSLMQHMIQRTAD